MIIFGFWAAFEAVFFFFIFQIRRVFLFLGYQPWSYFRFIGEGHYVSFIPKTGMLKNNLLHQMIRR